jgi:hypothetical protein
MAYILDIDLDFFQQDVCYSPSKSGSRLSDQRAFAPWSKKAVRSFLENRCLLSKSSPKPGFFCVTHDLVFDKWNTMIRESMLQPPFHVVHVDAHADLGLGFRDLSFRYIFSEILHRQVSQRCKPRRGDKDGLKEGNFLSFALACRWISKLTFVPNPKSHDDLPRYMFKDFDTNSGFLQLKKYHKAQIDNSLILDNVVPIEVEPTVPFERIAISDFLAESQFDFVFLTQSPTYTLPTTDRLIPIINEYTNLLDYVHAA